MIVDQKKFPHAEIGKKLGVLRGSKKQYEFAKELGIAIGTYKGYLYPKKATMSIEKWLCMVYVWGIIRAIRLYMGII